jgi:phosphatidylinositol glycan class C protein
VLFAFELFLLSPFLWRLVRRASLAAHLAAAALLAAVTCVACWRIAGGVAGAALAAAHCGLTAACPAVLIRIHKFKANINGPWDEAVPHLPLPQTYPLVQGQQKRL